MSKYMVKHGAVLQCSFGSCEGCLKASGIKGTLLKDEKEAVITDFLPEVNIPSFGLCKSPLGGGTCTPVTIKPWVKEKEDFIVGDVPAIMDDSILPCLKGGIISIKENGQ